MIPAVLRQRALNIAHDGHPGMTMMKSYLRTAVWWPKLDTDVEAYVKKCRGCTLVAVQDAPEPMMRKEMPTGPWEDIAIDFLGPLPEGQHLFVVVDSYSRYLEVCEMTNTESKETIQHLLEIFGRYGVPSLIKADNGPQFSSEEFKRFCQEYGIQLVNTIPYWPQMNGQVERQNRSILKRLRIAQELGKDWRKELREFLLVYHSTNHSTTGEAPSKLMFGRRIKGRLPRVPASIDDESVRDFDNLQKAKGKLYSDKKRHAEHSDIQEGDRVLVKRMKKDHKLQTDFAPEEFQVIHKKGSDTTVRSSLSGKEFRRNVTHLKKVPDSNDKTSDDKDDERVQNNEHQLMEENAQHSTTNAGSLPQTEDSRGKRKRREPVRYDDYVPYYVEEAIGGVVASGSTGYRQDIVMD